MQVLWGGRSYDAFSCAYAAYSLSRLRVELVQPLHGRGTARDGIGMVLREVAYRHLVAPDDKPGVHVKVPVGILYEAGRAANQRFQESGFAHAVAAHEGDL